MNYLMFQIIFVVSDWIFITQIILLFPPFWLGKQIFKIFSLEFSVSSWGAIHCIFKECVHHKFKDFSYTWWNIQVRKNYTSILVRDKALLKKLKKYERMCPWVYSWRTRVVNPAVDHLSAFNLGVRIYWMSRK